MPGFVEKTKTKIIPLEGEKIGNLYHHPKIFGQLELKFLNHNILDQKICLNKYTPCCIWLINLAGLN